MDSWQKKKSHTPSLYIEGWAQDFRKHVFETHV